MLRSLLVAFALALPALPAAAQEDRGFLTMTGIATVEAAPDITRARGSLFVEGDSAGDALDMAKKRLVALRRTMEPFGEVEASRITLGQNNSRVKSLIGSGDPGFSARGSIAVTLADPDKAGTALDALVRAGIDGVAYLDHDIADRAALVTEARERAVADALLRARTYARAAELDLGPIVDLSETGTAPITGAYRGPVDHDGSRYGGAQGMKGPQTIGVTAIVTIRWAIE